MKKELILSVLLHLVIILFLMFFKLPERSLHHEEIIIPVDIVDIGDVTQSNKLMLQESQTKDVSKAQPQEEIKELLPSSGPEKSQPPQSEGMVKEPEEVAQSAQEQKAVPQEENKQEEREPAPDQSEQSQEEEAEAQKEAEEAPPSLPKTKPQPPAKEAKKEAEKKKKRFQSLLKNLVASGAPSSSSSDEKEETSSTEDSDNLPKGEGMSITEQDIIRRQISKCWSVDVGAKDLKNLKVPLRIHFNPDTSVKKVDILEEDRYRADLVYHAAANKAINALKAPACTPLKLPLKKYDEWRTVRMTFDPSLMAQ